MFQHFYEGIYQFGPYQDHVVGFWNASMEFPEKVLILTYEDLKKDPLDCMKKMAKYLGQPIFLEEEKDGIVEEIVKLCSFDNLSNWEVNKTGVQRFSSAISIESHVFFRKGNVGDQQTHLSAEWWNAQIESQRKGSKEQTLCLAFHHSYLLEVFVPSRSFLYQLVCV